MNAIAGKLAQTALAIAAMAALLLSTLSLVPGPALAQEPAAGPNRSGAPLDVEFQRVFVPEDRSQEWPRAGFTYAPQMPIDTFEGLIRQARARLERIETPPRYAKAELHAVLSGSRLEGRCLLTPELASEPEGLPTAARFIPLGNTNLAFAPLAAESASPASTRLGLNQDQPGMIWGRQDPEAELQWSFRPTITSDGAQRYDLRLPDAQQIDFFLSGTADHALRVIRGAQRQKPLGKDQEDPSGGGSWHLVPDWTGRLTFEIDSNRPTGKSTRRTWVKQDAQFRIRGKTCESIARFSLVNGSQLPREFVLAVPGDLVITGVAVDDQQLDNTAILRGDDDQRQLRLDLSELSLSPESIIKVEAAHAIDSTSGNRPFSLPLVTPVSAMQESSVATVEIDETQTLARYEIRQAQPLGIVPDSGSGKTTLRFRVYGSNPRIALHLFPARARIVETAVHHLEFDDFSIRATTHLRIQPVAGQVLACDLPLGQGWQVDQVLDRETQTPRRWDQLRDEGSSTLRIEIDAQQGEDETSPSATVLEIQARRAREKDFGNFGLDELQPLLLNPKHDGVHWLMLMSGARYHVTPDTDGLVASISPDEISDDNRTLLDPDAQGYLFPLNGTHSARYLVRVAPKTIFYNADLQIEARVTPHRLRQEGTIELAGEGHAPQRITVWASQPLPEDTTWMVNGSKPARVLSQSRILLSEAEPSRPLYAYEVELGRNFSLPLQVETSFHLPAGGPAPAEPILLSIATAEEQTGQITVRTAVDDRLIANPDMLRSLYHSGIDWQADNRVLRYEYRPFELRRLTDADEVWLFRWDRPTPLPEAYCLEAQHQLHQGDDGTQRYHSRYVVQHRDSATLRFQLPSEATFLFAEVDGEFREGEVAPGGSLEIRLPRTPGRRTIDLYYEINQFPILLFGRVRPQLPQLDLPLGRQQLTVGLGDAIRPFDSQKPIGSIRGPLSVEEPTLADRLWRGVFPGRLLTGNPDPSSAALPPIETASLFQTPGIDGEPDAAMQANSKQSRTHQVRPAIVDGQPGPVWVVRQSAVVVAGYSILLLSCLLVAIGGRKFPLAAIIAWVLAAALALIAPPLLISWSSGLVVGISLGAVVAWFRPRGQTPEPSDQTDQAWPTSSTSLSTTSGAKIGGIVLGLIAVGLSSGSTLAQPTAPPMSSQAEEVERDELPRPSPPLAAPSSRVVYPVLIPIDSRRRPVGQAYLPQPFYEYLNRMTEPVAPPRIDYLIETIGYEFMLPGADSPEVVATTKITLTTFRPGLAISLSLDPKLGDHVESILINGGIQPGTWDDTSQTMSVVVRESGKHQLEIQSRIPTDDLNASRPELQIRSLRCPSTSVRIDSSRPGLTARLETNNRVFGPQPSLLKQEVNLGPIDQFKILWNMPEAAPRFEYDQFDLLEISEESVQLRVRFSVKPLQAQADRLALEIDPRLSLRSATIGGTEVNLTRDDDGTIYHLNLPPTAGGASTRLELAFRLRGTQRVSNLLFPNVKIAGADIRRRWAAVAAANDLQVQSDAESRVAIMSQDEFAREWKSPISGFRFAVSLVDTTPLEWVISTRPISTRAFAEIDHRYTFDEDGYDFQIEAELETYSGQTYQYVADIGAGHRIASVELLADGRERPLQWHYSSKTGKLGVLLLGPVDGQQSLSIRGRHPRSPLGEFVFRPATIEDVQTEGRLLTILRQPSVLAGVSDHRGLTAVEYEGAAGQRSQPVSLVGRFRLGSDLPEVPLEISRNDLLLTGDMLTTVARIDGTWQVEGLCKLDVRAGVVDYLDILVPANQVLQTERMERFNVSSRLVADQSLRVYRLIPKRNLGREFSLRLPMTLEVATGQMVGFGPVRIVGQPHIKQFAATPEIVGSQEVLWASRDLLPNPITDRWFQANVPRGFQLARATSSNYQCRMVNRMTSSGTSVVPLLEHQLQASPDGGVMVLSKAHVVPNGQQHIDWRLPPDWKLLGVFLEDEAIPFTQTADHGIEVRLKSRQLPQSVSILMSGKLDSVSTERPTEIEIPLPQPLGCEIQRTFAEVTAPAAWNHDSIPTLSAVSWLRARLLGELSLKTLAGDEFSGLHADEVARWEDIRRQRGLSVLEEIQSQFRRSGVSEQNLDEEIQGLLGKRWGEVQSWLIPGNKAPRAKNQSPPITRLVAAEGRQGLLDLTGTGDQDEGGLALRFEIVPPSGPARPWWPWLVSLSLVCVAVGIAWIPAWQGDLRSVPGGGPLADWMLRWPQVVGVSAGIFWYLFLPPHEFGLVLAALFALASIPLPRWR